MLCRAAPAAPATSTNAAFIAAATASFTATTYAAATTTPTAALAFPGPAVTTFESCCIALNAHAPSQGFVRVACGWLGLCIGCDFFGCNCSPLSPLSAATIRGSDPTSVSCGAAALSPG